VAVKSGDTALTYAELDAAANRVARAVLAAAPAGPVGLLLPHDVTAVAAFLGVIKAGGIAVPLAAQAPDAMLAAILEDTAAPLLIAGEAGRARAERVTCAQGRVLTVEEIERSASSSDPGGATSPDTIACLHYTSGSTGRPKGVPHTHRNAVHMGRRLGCALGVSPGDRVTLFASLAAGQGLTNTTLALVNGAGLYLWDIRAEGLSALADWLEREEITIYRSSASVFRHFADGLTGRLTLPRLRVVGLSSEPVHAHDVERFRRHFPEGCRLVNVLSSTEAGSLFADVVDHAAPLDGAPIPIGYPLQDMDVRIVDESGREVAPGEPGEIVIHSRYLFPGYWRRPDPSAAVLASGERRAYRTGDLGRELDDGRFVHLGRLDFRVKIRGHRVETTEVELALGRHPEVSAAAVTARPDAHGELRLVAYVVPTRWPPPDAGTLRQFLVERLPDSMLPAAFVPLRALPLTASGKVDRRSLPEPADAGAARGRTPRTPVEEGVAAIWAEVLGSKRVAIDADFLDLGGNSLLAVRIGARVLAEFEVAVPLSALLEAATVERMALLVTEQLARSLPPGELAELVTEVRSLPSPHRSA
jgi:amino acid adenylation domain-containing protein